MIAAALVNAIASSGSSFSTVIWLCIQDQQDRSCGVSAFHAGGHLWSFSSLRLCCGSQIYLRAIPDRLPCAGSLCPSGGRWRDRIRLFLCRLSNGRRCRRGFRSGGGRSLFLKEFCCGIRCPGGRARRRFQCSGQRYQRCSDR